MLFLCFTYTSSYNSLILCFSTAMMSIHMIKWYNDTCFDWFLYSDSSHVFLSFEMKRKKKTLNQFPLVFVLCDLLLNNKIIQFILIYVQVIVSISIKLSILSSKECQMARIPDGSV